jgi:hypothetical protein
MYVYSYYINLNVMRMTSMFKQFVAFMFKKYEILIKFFYITTITKLWPRKFVM